MSEQQRPTTMTCLIYEWKPFNEGKVCKEAATHRILDAPLFIGIRPICKHHAKTFPRWMVKKITDADLKMCEKLMSAKPLNIP